MTNLDKWKKRLNSILKKMGDDTIETESELIEELEVLVNDLNIEIEDELDDD